MEKLQPPYTPYQPEIPDTRTRSSRPRVARTIVRAAVGLSFVWLLYFGVSHVVNREGNPFAWHHAPPTRRYLCGFFDSPGNDAQQPMIQEELQPHKVALEAHIMSKCPDAQACLQQLVVPTMEQASDLVDFELSFIANVSDKSSAITCMHGPEECVGDSLILCAQSLPYPPEGDEATPIRMPTIRSLGFANCLISSYHDIPDRWLVQRCALQHGIDFNALNECASRQEDDPSNGEVSGLALLRESAQHSASLGVKTSCTVRLDEEVWCVRDGGVWKDCAKDGEGSKVSVLVDEIKKRAGRNSELVGSMVC